MALATDSPDSMAALWAKAEAQAEAYEKTVETKIPVKPANDAKDEPEPANDTEAEPAKEEPAKAKPEAEKSKDEPADEGEGTDDEKAQLQELAKKLGYALDGNKVTVQERVKWREEKRQGLAKIAEREQAFNAKVAEVEQGLQKKFGRAAQALEAWERGDFDGVAKALEGDDKVGWRDLQGRAAQRIMSPEAKRIRELEEKLEADKREREQREEQERQTLAQREEQQRVEAFRSKLASDMGASDNRILKALSQQPQFVGAVMDVIRRKWVEDGEALTAEEALHQPFGSGTLLDNAKTLWQSLNAAFGNPAALEQEAPSGVGNRGAEDSARPGKKPKTLSRNGAAEVSARGQYKDDSDFIRQWSKRIAEADD